jgi:hypothetical protein
MIVLYMIVSWHQTLDSGSISAMRCSAAAEIHRLYVSNLAPNLTPAQDCVAGSIRPKMLKGLHAILNYNIFGSITHR